MGPFAAFEDGPVLAQAIVNTVGGDARAPAGRPQASSEAVSLGLIVIESVINALKHAFPQDKADGRIVVAYGTNEFGWTLSIAANGVGKPHEGAVTPRPAWGRSSSRRWPRSSMPASITSATSTAPPCLSSTRARYRLLGPVTERSAYLCRLFIRCCNFTMG